VVVVEAILNAEHGWRDLPVVGVALYEGDTDENLNGAQLSIRVSALHQSSHKFCAGLHYTAVYFDFSTAFVICAK